VGIIQLKANLLYFSKFTYFKIQTCKSCVYCTMQYVKSRVQSQSRQSAKPFLQSSELGLPQPLPAGECEHTRWRKRGWESPNSDEGTYTVVLLKYTYFVGTFSKGGRHTALLKDHSALSSSTSDRGSNPAKKTPST
jgi:hypothetical protein